MDRLRLATYNVEWFNALFDDRGHVHDDYQLSARYKISRGQQLAALGIVFKSLDADGILIIEAPDTNGKRSTVKALEGFARRFKLRTRKAVIGFVSETEQEIAFLYDPEKLHLKHDPQGEPTTRHGATGAPRFDGTFRYDLDADGVEETIRFSKPPLELAITTASGKVLRLIGVHAKSKVPHGRVTPEEFSRISIDNRRKQLAECLWIRARAEAHLTARDPLIVLGDLNDGPGLDEYERLFGHSGIEIVLGLAAEPALRLYDAHADMALRQRTGITPTTARFYLSPKKRFFEALVDFIMVSPDLAARAPDWRIWHPFNDPAVLDQPDLADALLTASDHFPVTLDIEL